MAINWQVANKSQVRKIAFLTIAWQDCLFPGVAFKPNFYRKRFGEEIRTWKIWRYQTLQAKKHQCLWLVLSKTGVLGPVYELDNTDIRSLVNARLPNHSKRTERTSWWTTVIGCVHANKLPLCVRNTIILYNLAGSLIRIGFMKFDSPILKEMRPGKFRWVFGADYFGTPTCQANQVNFI